MLRVYRISKTYRGPDGALKALDGVSLRLKPGEFVAVQGPSGCGKSTLLLAAGGLLVPDEGQVTFEGDDIYSLSPNERALFRARHVGFVFQQFHLVPYLSVIDNVLAAALPVGMSGAEARALELVRQLGLEPRARHVPAELSTGEKQRTAMARAFLNEPRFLLADEPTGNLDRDNARLVLDEMRLFARKGGAVLLVTHDPLAASFAERTVRMEAGRLLEDGSEATSRAAESEPAAGETT